MKLLFIILIFFIVETFFLSTDLKFNSDKKIDINDIQIEFKDSKSYFISSKYIDKMLIADKIQQGKGFKIFFKPVLTFYDGNKSKTIVCNKAFLNEYKNILSLEENINIAYDSYLLKSRKILYDIKKEIIIDSQKFNLIGKNIDAKGDHLYFDIKNSIIKAKSIEYIVELE